MNISKGLTSYGPRVYVIEPYLTEIRSARLFRSGLTPLLEVVISDHKFDKLCRVFPDD